MTVSRYHTNVVPTPPARAAVSPLLASPDVPGDLGGASGRGLSAVGALRQAPSSATGGEPVTMLPDPTRKLLYRAAEVIEERGWTTGAWEDRQGRVCMTGAIKVAADLPTNYLSATGKPTGHAAAVNRALGALCSHLGIPAPVHNDQELASGEEAAATLRAAADQQAGAWDWPAPSSPPSTSTIARTASPVNRRRCDP